MHVRACVCACMRECVCVCMCQRERERERDSTCRTSGCLAIRSLEASPPSFKRQNEAEYECNKENMRVVEVDWRENGRENVSKRKSQWERERVYVRERVSACVIE